MINYISVVPFFFFLTLYKYCRAIQKSNCYHKEGHEANCGEKDQISTILFGLLQILVSQIPNFHNIAWLSVVAAVMSFCYASTGLGLAFAKVLGIITTFHSPFSSFPSLNPSNYFYKQFILDNLKTKTL